MRRLRHMDPSAHPVCKSRRVRSKTTGGGQGTFAVARRWNRVGESRRSDMRITPTRWRIYRKAPGSRTVRDRTRTGSRHRRGQSRDVLVSLRGRTARRARHGYRPRLILLRSPRPKAAPTRSPRLWGGGGWGTDPAPQYLIPRGRLLAGHQVGDQVADLLIGQGVEQPVGHDRAARRGDFLHVAGPHLEPLSLLVEVLRFVQICADQQAGPQPAVSGLD